MTVIIINLHANFKVVFFSPFQSYFLHANLKVVQKNSGTAEIITVEQQYNYFEINYINNKYLTSKV